MNKDEQKIKSLIEQIKAKGFYEVDENGLAYHVVCYTIKNKEHVKIKKIKHDKVTEYAEYLADKLKCKVYNENELHNIVVATLEESDEMLWERESLTLNGMTDKKELEALQNIKMNRTISW